MGVARGECLSKRAGSSCSCPPREFNGRWKRQVPPAARPSPSPPSLAPAPPPLPEPHPPTHPSACWPFYSPTHPLPAGSPTPQPVPPAGSTASPAPSPGRSRSRTPHIYIARVSQVSQPHISRLMVGLKYAKTAAGTWAAAPGKPRKGGERDARGEAAAAGGTPSCSCVIRLTVLNTSVDATHGHKFKLTSLMSGFYTGNLVGQAAQWAADYDLI